MRQPILFGNGKDKQCKIIYVGMLYARKAKASCFKVNGVCVLLPA